MPLVSGEIYHIFNRGIDKRPTFLTKRHYARAVETLRYYEHITPPIRLSKYFLLGEQKKKEVLSHIKPDALHVDILSYTLMPNHFHLLVRQREENGISRFLSNFQNSYTRYFNTKGSRVGPLFLDQFKAVHIEDNEQLLHVHRYIHLNPISSFVVKTEAHLQAYRWSSLPEYLGSAHGFCETSTVLGQFKTTESYKKFLFDQIEYQQSLEMIKHLILEIS